LERPGRVPDEGLHVGAERRAVERAVDGAVLQPVGRVVGLGRRLGVGGRRLELAGLGERGQQARLGNESDVRRIAAVHAYLQLRLELAAALIVDLDAGAVAELLPGLLQQVGLGVPDGRVDRDLLAVVAVVLVKGGALGRVTVSTSTAAVVAAGTGAEHQTNCGRDHEGLASSWKDRHAVLLPRRYACRVDALPVPTLGRLHM
jgi:hypothetical protein